jgi:hypothetical protein
MKREAPSCSKMKRLCRLLDIPLYQAVGMLELLWHLTAREAPRGDIGKLSNEDIALAVDYRQNEDVLIEVLVRTRWLDVSAEHRLLIHDWQEHADEAVKKRLTRSGQSFISARHVETKPPCVETKQQNGNLPRAGAGPEPEPEPHPEPEPEPDLKTSNPLTPPSATAELILVETTSKTLKEAEALAAEIADTLDSLPSSEKVLGRLDEHLPPPKRELRKQERAAVRRLFTYYLRGTQRNPKLYTLTRARMEKGILRLEDCLRVCNGDLGKAEQLMGCAIDALFRSDYHSAGKNDRQKIYTDWIEHLFKSTEKLQWWLGK